MEKTREKPDLRVLRMARGWSQQQAADRAGISRSYIGMLETNGRIPSVAVARKLARVYGIAWHDFF